jgi:hypothetical protein
MIQECDKHNILFDDWDFRNIVYYSQFSDGKNFFEFDVSQFNDIWIRWRFFQFQEYFSYALEAILHIFVRELKAKEHGLTANDFIEIVKPCHHAIAEKLSLDVQDKSINDIINAILQSFNCEKLTKNSSLQFDKSCNLSSHLNEQTLTDEIEQLIQTNGDSADILSLSLLLMIIVFTRYFHYHNSFDEKYVWYHSGAIEEIGLVSFTEEILPLNDTMNLTDFLKNVLNQIIVRHNSIAWDKMAYGNDTFRFKELTPGRFTFARDVTPVWRNTKMSGVLGIIEDLRLCATTEQTRSLTSDAIRILEKV